MTGWETLSLSAIAQGGESGIAGGPFGSALGRKDYTSSGVPVIRGAQLGNERGFSHDDLVYVSDEKADRHRGNLAFPGDVIVTQRGTLGQVGLIPVDAPYERYLLSQSQMKITVDPECADRTFLFYALREPGVVARLTDQALIAGVPHINLGILRNFPLTIPPLATQRRIATVLAAFDDLIALHTRRIDLLEDLARSLYREWFVRFRFPGHEDAGLVETEIGAIPRGWSITRLGRAAESLVDGDWIETKDQGGDAYRLLQVSNVGVGVFRETGKFRYVSSDTFKRLRCTQVVEGDILISRMPDPIGRAWLVDYLPEPAITAVDVAILRPKTPASGLYLSLFLNAPSTLAHAESVATGTTRKRVSRSVLADFRLAEPPDEVVEAFADVVGPIFGQRSWLTRASSRLAAVRDLLLPRLMTGRLDVADVDLGDLIPAEEV